VRLAADANVLLSAILGGRARLILEHPQVSEVLTTQQTLAEVQEYAVVLARKKRLAEDLVLLAVGALPVTLVERPAYAAAVSEASKRIGRRDPDDVEILALAISLKVPVWSNDKDFEGSGVEWYTTESLLRELGMIDVP
jgi:predicted nucleic acid-binding protein